MFERFTGDARLIVRHATQHARRLGHRYVGAEHLLLAAVSAAPPAGAVMRAHGLTPDLVEEEIARRMGLGAGAGLFGGLDRDALATIGIDLDAVRARIEASFGPQALDRAARSLAPEQYRRLRTPGPVQAWRDRRRMRRAAPVRPPAPRCAGGDRALPGPRPAARRAYPVYPDGQEDPGE